MSQNDAPKHHENWLDDDCVSEWIGKQKDRETVRSGQFARLRAIIPFDNQSSFRYLNIGAGPGPLDALLLERYPNAGATLLDGSSVMLDSARQVLAPFGTRAEFIQANLETAEWRNDISGSFDVVVSCIAIHNLEDPSRIRTLYQEIYDAVAPGGLFVNMDYVRMSSPLLRSLAEWANSDRESGFTRGGGRASLPGTVDEQILWLREAGFASVDCFWRDFSIALFGGFKGEAHVPSPEQRGSN